jgi:hypothetical protein
MMEKHESMKSSCQQTIRKLPLFNLKMYGQRSLSLPSFISLLLISVLLMSFCCLISAQTKDINSVQNSSTRFSTETQNGIKNESGVIKTCDRNTSKGFSDLGPTPPVEDKTESVIDQDIKSNNGNESTDSISFAVKRDFPFQSRRLQLADSCMLTDKKVVPKNPLPPNNKQNGDTGFHWRSALKQTLLFLGIQHGYAFSQPKTRLSVKGKFFKDYLNSLKSLRGWEDGGRFFTNYIAHPMQGSFVGYIQIQNDPKGLRQRFGSSKDYWKSRMKALAWSAAWSTQFEIGPVSQASIGNVGLQGKQTWIDIVITPTAGIGMLITEDAIDRFLIERIERNTKNFYLKIISRVLLNPTRTVANIFRFKTPWYRDRPRAR